MKNRELLAHLFEACKDARSVVQSHSQILKSGLAHESFFVTKLITSYAENCSIESAVKLFEETPQRTVYLWNAILRSHGREKQWDVTLGLFLRMFSTATTTSTTNAKPDNFTVPIALKACVGLSALGTGKAIHGLVKKNEKIGSDMFVGSALIELYTKFGEMGDALRVFEEFPQPDVVLWTSMVTGYQQNGNAEEALSFFTRMAVAEGVPPGPVTLVSVVSACVQLTSLEAGKCVHGFTIRRGFNSDLPLVNSLLNLYAKTGSINNARNLFGKMPEKDVISWSSMIACYSLNDKSVEALGLFNEMIEKRFEPNSVTMVSALQACAVACDLEKGRRIHELAKQKKIELDMSVSTSLIDMYMKCSCLKEAVDIFQRLPKKDVVSWATLISGYARNGLANESLGIFCSMLSDGTRPDAVTVVKILMACSELGTLRQALCLHGYVASTGFDDNVFVGAALIDLYSKCGNLYNSIKVFDGMSKRDVVVWSSLIAGYGNHGLGGEAIRTFHQMIKTTEIKPNHVTFLSVLSACSHNGFIEEGIEIFDMMVHEHHIDPNLEHYSVMVDLLGRTGKLDEAMDFIDQMPVSPGPHVWGALLGACRIHHNVKIGEIVAKNLLQLDPNHAGYYMLLSNIYAVDGKWEDAAKMKTLIKEKGLKKVPGHSLIEVGSRVHTFLVADRWHEELESIHRLLREMEVKMREEGYVPDVGALHDVEEAL